MKKTHFPIQNKGFSKLLYISDKVYWPFIKNYSVVACLFKEGEQRDLCFLRCAPYSTLQKMIKNDREEKQTKMVVHEIKKSNNS